ncbi:flagellin [Kozakia baliensis]|uniref:flagellin n=1 Tax=Kozakia baliensis TaxID=153496 RepID=UPI00345C2942
MSGAISQFGNNGPSLILKRAVSDLSAQQNAQQLEVTTGVSSDSYAGLGPSRTRALSLQPALTQTQAWSNNVTLAQNRLEGTQNALSQISTMATDFSKTLLTLSGNASSDVTQAAISEARQNLQNLGALLNTKNGDDYVFAGQASTIAPVSGNTDLSQSHLAASIAETVAQSGNSNGAGVLSQTLQMAGQTTPENPFSASLSTSPNEAAKQSASYAIGQNQAVQAGVTATQGQASSETSTGSPIRDLMRNLMVVASLGKVTTGTQNYDQLVQGLISSNNEVTSGLTTMSSTVGVTQNTLKFQSSMLGQMKSSLTAQLSESKSADLATVSTQLTQTKNQLQASYSIIADMKGMNLASYL